MFFLGAVLCILLVLFLVTFFKTSLIGIFTTSQARPSATPLLDAPDTPFFNNEGEAKEILPVKKVLLEYVEITGGCGPHFEGTCLRVRSGPGTEYPTIARLRNGMVLKIADKVERAGHVWYKVVFDETLHYPERVVGDWYIAAEHATVLLDEGLRTIDDEKSHEASTTKRIVVNRTKQTLSAYEGDAPFMSENISTGLELTPTPAGDFIIFRKTPSRYMQGPVKGIADQYYDMPGVPWNLYFTHGGAVIHGAYWHTSFGQPYSHGCVNLPPDKARELYYWADLGTKVTVID